MKTGLGSFTIPKRYWPPTVLDLVRLLLAFPDHARHVEVIEVDYEAGTFRYVAS